MRWLRLYDDTINDPKVLKLPEAMRWHWVALLCVASKNGGSLPPLDDIAIQLRVTTGKATEIVAVLVKAGLIDKTETGLAPHNWNGRQYKSDVSNDRVSRYRQRKRNVTCNVTVTPPETEDRNREQKDTEAIASGAEAPDPRKRLFDEGLHKLAKMTGKGPDSCRSFVGKCLKDAGDDAITVLGLIEDAERNRVADPSAWIRARLPGANNAPSGSKVIQASDDLRRKVASFDGPARAADGLRSGEGEAPPRLLSHG